MKYVEGKVIDTVIRAALVYNLITWPELLTTSKLI